MLLTSIHSNFKVHANNVITCFHNYQYDHADVSVYWCLFTGVLIEMVKQ